ncbi:MAG: TIR domain-containing protein [Chitinophagales bacterium]
MKNEINIFIAYSREDTAYIHKLRKYLHPLQRNRAIKIWYDGEIIAGTVWEEEIKKHLHAADIILLLVSSNSLYSEYFYDKEVKEALERHEAAKTTVIPVILAACLWEETPLRDLQVLPKDGFPIDNWSKEADAYVNIVRGISKRIDIIHDRRSQTAEAIAIEKRKRKADEVAALTEKQEEERQQQVAAEKAAEKQAEQDRRKKVEKEATEKRLTSIKRELEKATNAFENADYRQTIILAKTVLRLDRNNNIAKQLKSAAEKVLNEQRKAVFAKITKNKLIKFGIPTTLSILLLFFVFKQYAAEADTKASFYGFRDMDKKGKWGIMSEKNDTIVAAIYDNIGKFDGKYMAVEKADKWGYIDKTGRVIVPLEYDNVSFEGFENDIAEVKKDTLVYYINPKGDCVKNCPTDKKEKVLEKQYQKLVEEGNELFLAEKQEQAIAKYEAALKINSTGQAAKDGLAKCKLAIEVQKKSAKAQEQKIQKKYDALIKEANQFYEQKEFWSAKTKFEEALKHKPNSSKAKSGIEKCKEAMQTQQNTPKGSECGN